MTVSPRPICCVDFTCLHCFSQTRFASAVEHELVNPDVECVLSWRRVSCEQQLVLLSILWTSECYMHALVVSVVTWRKCTRCPLLPCVSPHCGCPCVHSVDRMTDSRTRVVAPDFACLRVSCKNSSITST